MEERKMDIKLFDSELAVMNVIWEHGDITAKEISDILKESIGWNINTTYTVIKKCIKKGAVERREPKFVCHALITREESQKASVDELSKKMFGGSAERMFASLLANKSFSKKEIDNLKKMIEDYEE